MYSAAGAVYSVWLNELQVAFFRPHVPAVLLRVVNVPRNLPLMLAMLDKNGVPAPGAHWAGGSLLELLSACEACDPETAALRGSCAVLDLYGASDPVAAVPGMLPWGPPSYEQAEATLEAGRTVAETLGRLNSRFALAAVA